jgi:tetratricopeptide (TPR) repeat protein
MSNTQSNTHIPQTSPFFVAAQLEAAKISVKSEGTINLFIQLQEVMKTTETAQRRGVYMALGDVCKKADLYKDALKAYNIVIDQHIYDDGIVKKIGDLLLVSHQYQQAVNHYQTFANESGTTIELFLIFVKMGNMRGAQKIFDEGINNGLASDEKVEYEHSVIFFIISATLLYCQKHFEESYRYLTKGTKIHLSFRNKPWLSKALSMEKVTDLVSFFISFQLPTIIMTRKIASSKHDDDLNLCYLSMQLYGENEYTLFGTIQILFQHRRFDKCRSYCNKLLALNNSHEGTISILGRLYTTKADFEAAYTLYKNMFTKHAQCYFVSFHFLQLLHRMDKKEEMESVLVHLAKEHSNVASGDKGYEACLVSILLDRYHC